MGLGKDAALRLTYISPWFGSGWCLEIEQIMDGHPVSHRCCFPKSYCLPSEPLGKHNRSGPILLLSIGDKTPNTQPGLPRFTLPVLFEVIAVSSMMSPQNNQKGLRDNEQDCGDYRNVPAMISYLDSRLGIRFTNQRIKNVGRPCGHHRHHFRIYYTERIN